MGHQRWLDDNHAFIFDTVSFDGSVEVESKPPRVNGDELMEQLEVMEANNQRDSSSVLGK